MLTVINETEPIISKNGKEYRAAIFQCDCGSITTKRIDDVKNGRTKSCGCWRSTVTTNKNLTHGLFYHPLYTVWINIKARCSSENFPQYKDYGGRGIQLCDKWNDDFKSFYDWAIANSYKKSLVIDRIDNDKGYCPENCRFVDRSISAINTRLLSVSNTIGYRGVDKISDKCYRARIGSYGNRIDLGCYKTPEDAAMAYDHKAIELELGHPLNFPSEV